MSLLGISSAGLFFGEEGGAVVNEYLCPIDGIIETEELVGDIEDTELSGIIEQEDLTGDIECE